MPLQVVIADDEVLARQKLLLLLREEPDIEVVGEGANASETIDLVQLHATRCLVARPSDAGHGRLRCYLSSQRFFAAEPALYYLHDGTRSIRTQAFEVHAVDYLLKPFTRERLSIALEHARDHQE